VARKYVCSTAGCGRISERPKCEKCRSQPEVRRNEAQRRLYRTARWKRLRAIVLARDCGLCQECERHGRTKLGSEIDHVVPAARAAERFWDAANLETLCKACHGEKTRRGE
jgi:5-methylcytosine-specific restriction endonuclease McrA